uniref:Guanylate cyclase domain-containing protein n=1 Tax=Palpitomonas bilix TaxID=652834 RepID=A0A7S3DAF8_9EUKA|mmetsp:Transcript_28608/g.72979  ORF Transcript_28608/g.72979 Transcript_28608/m.72979 type:complete len:653 (+) Transcript_28608:222-2180(+)
MASIGLYPIKEERQSQGQNRGSAGGKGLNRASNGSQRRSSLARTSSLAEGARRGSVLTKRNSFGRSVNNLFRSVKGQVAHDNSDAFNFIESMVERIRLQKIKMHAFSLVFSDKAMETKFDAKFYTSSIFQIRLAVVIFTAVMFLMGATDVFLKADVRIWSVLLIIRYTCICPLSLIFMVLTFTKVYAKRMQLCGTLLSIMIGLALQMLSVYGQEPGHGWAMIYMVVAAFFFGLRFLYLLIVVPVLLVGFVGMVGTFQAGYFRIDPLNVTVSNLTMLEDHALREPTLTESAVFLLFIVFGILYAVYLSESGMRREYLASSMFECESKNGKYLLRSMLPQHVADRLFSAKNQMVKDEYKEVTILFTDIANFQSITDKADNESVVNLLNSLFAHFDRASDGYDLYKVETVGDTYMVVGGIPDENVEHTKMICNLALDLLETAEKFKHPSCEKIELRVGLHVGPVTAGVIGTHRPFYHLFGDTVNTAARMVHTNTGRNIQCTRAVLEKAEMDFDFEERGLVKVKGKGEMTTYYLRARKSSALVYRGSLPTLITEDRNPAANGTEESWKLESARSEPAIDEHDPQKQEEEKKRRVGTPPAKQLESVSVFGPAGVSSPATVIDSHRDPIFGTSPPQHSNEHLAAAVEGRISGTIEELN